MSCVTVPPQPLEWAVFTPGSLAASLSMGVPLCIPPGATALSVGASLPPRQ